ncbi:hypothetical protein DFJ73DRAFT_669300 [Zopfochytrium polystomum]|nr:hypothetical protein DFJ73DRAFT_669300 [Zopfochytrium polystomum]
MRKNGELCRFAGVRVFTRRKGQSACTYGPHFLSRREDSSDKYALVAAADPALSFAVPSSGRDAPAPSDVPVHIGVDGRPHVATTLSNEVYVQEKTAAVCIEILDREIKHASQEPVYYWLPRTPVSRTKASSTARQLCDECTTSIFCGYWFCAVCGKEICMDCFETALETSEVGDPTDAWRCASRGRGSPLKAHRPEQFIPVIKIPQAQLELVRERAMLRLTGPPRPDVVVPDVPGYDFAPDTSSVVRLSSTTPPDQAERVFEREWSEGRPVLRSIDPGLIQADWSSKEFTAKFVDDTPTIVDCETKIEHHITVSNFFGGFDNSALRPQSKNKSLVLKLEVAERSQLQDWPMTTDFADKLPEHFNDYTRCLPFPRYTSRTGDRNLAARLPQIHLPPDLSPKMHIAYGSTDTIGTTPLHTELADSVNLLLHALIPDTAAKMEAEPPGHEFKIFDPLHDGLFYLDAALRRRLWTEHGVRGWRVMQRVGDAVLVPAGCAHQVRNYVSCVKVAADFVSPENLRECAALAAKLRTLGRSHQHRREDLLQPKSIIWDTWTSTVEDPEKASAAAAAVVAAAAASTTAAAATAATAAGAAAAAAAVPVDTPMAEPTLESAIQKKRKRPPPGSMVEPPLELEMREAPRPPKKSVVRPIVPLPDVKKERKMSVPAVTPVSPPTPPAATLPIAPSPTAPEPP